MALPWDGLVEIEAVAKIGTVTAGGVYDNVKMRDYIFKNVKKLQLYESVQ